MEKPRLRGINITNDSNRGYSFSCISGLEKLYWRVSDISGRDIELQALPDCCRNSQGGINEASGPSLREAT
jgi:hypothetical protein